MDRGDRGDISLRLHELMKIYSGRPKYKGRWDEDLIGKIEVYEFCAVLCNLIDEEKCEGIPVMLDEEALS